MGREPMMSWTEGFLTDCEEHPALIGNDDPDDTYSATEVVRAVRWLYDRCQQLEGERDALRSVVRRLRDGWAEMDEWVWTLAEADAIRAALGDVGGESTA